MKQTAILQEGGQLPAVVLRLAGEGVPTLAQTYAVSDWLRIELYESPGNNILEEIGRLICLPVDDESFGLQLAFTLQQEDDWSLFVLHVHPQFLAQWPSTLLHSQQAFRFDHAAEHELRVDAPIKNTLSHLLTQGDEDGFGTSLLFMEHALQLLRRTVEQLAVAFAPFLMPACRFLAYESEREKIHKAREILDVHFDERLTIKDLARKVAMNECYLKKGFKTLTGKTIHEYIAARRIASARQMLQIENRTVTEVAAALGYSSISHFSTAFKRATGLKPCELLS